MGDLAEQTGLALRILKGAARDEGWRKKLETKHGGATPDAAQAAELVKKHAATQELVAEEDNQTASVIGEIVPSELDALLQRHRMEWAAPRAMSAEAVRMRNTDPTKSFERAKLAKITAETLKLVQDGERKAHGIDAGDVPPGSVVVIERA